jgi:hypothetical protein
MVDRLFSLLLMFCRFVLFTHLHQLLEEEEIQPLIYLIERILGPSFSANSQTGRHSEYEDTLSIYLTESTYSDDVSKITSPTMEGRGERNISEQTL